MEVLVSTILEVFRSTSSREFGQAGMSQLCLLQIHNIISKYISYKDALTLLKLQYVKSGNKAFACHCLATQCREKIFIQRLAKSLDEYFQALKRL